MSFLCALYGGAVAIFLGAFFVFGYEFLAFAVHH